MGKMSEKPSIRLRNYIRDDVIYQKYKKNKDLSKINDYDKFCIEHCEDIEYILEENITLKSKLKEK